MNFKPLNDRVLVQRIAKETTSTGGIIIPDSAKEKPAEATVIAMGPGKRGKDGQRVEMEISVGDRILFGKYSGSEIKLSSENYLILREDDILAVLEK